MKKTSNKLDLNMHEILKLCISIEHDLKKEGIQNYDLTKIVELLIEYRYLKNTNNELVKDDNNEIKNLCRESIENLRFNNCFDCTREELEQYDKNRESNQRNLPSLIHKEWKTIVTCKEMLLHSVFHHPDIPYQSIEQSSKGDIKEILQTCLKARDGLKQNDSNILKNITKVFIEHNLLKSQNLCYEEIEEKIRNNSTAIKLDNCFDFYEEERQSKIKKYLSYILLRSGTQDAKFYCDVTFTDGFLSPLYLIAGPLRYFADAWPKIVKEYSLAIENNNNPVQALQSSIFTTWIAWGPSIPICKCEEWGQGHPDRRITIQYGFGDENNSIPILLQPGEHIGDNIALEAVFYNPTEQQTNLVSQATITAKPVLLSESTRLANIAKAQTELIDGKNEELVLELQGKLSRNSDDNSIKFKSIGHDNYYTAYVWILFAVIKLGELEEFKIQMNQMQDLTWRKLLPFFEHVNIADSISYETQKRNLARKALGTIQELHPQNGSLEFVYLCAFDDCNCYNSYTEQENQLLISTRQPIIETFKSLIEEDRNHGISLPTIHISNPSPLPAHSLPKLIDKMNKFINPQECQG
jgi:hypothetical protein